jgi:hypothetical protein
LEEAALGLCPSPSSPFSVLVVTPLEKPLSKVLSRALA